MCAYDRTRLKYMKEFGTWEGFDSLSVKFKFANEKNLSGIAYYFYKHKVLFNLFFLSSKTNPQTLLVKLADTIIGGLEVTDVRLREYVSIIYTMLFSNFYTTITAKFSYLNSFEFIKNANYILTDFLKYAVWNQRYDYYDITNKRKLYGGYGVVAGYLMGFKLHCLGRFSRKQRASNTWFREARIPLNTLKSDIDFAFFTVPLKNSAVTIKIWLYRHPKYSQFYFKVL